MIYPNSDNMKNVHKLVGSGLSRDGEPCDVFAGYNNAGNLIMYGCVKKNGVYIKTCELLVTYDLTFKDIAKIVDG